MSVINKKCLTNREAFFVVCLGLSIIQLFTTLVILYLAITAGMGYFSYLPWVSNIIKGNMGN